MIAENIQKNKKDKKTRVLNTIYTLTGGALLLVLFLLLNNKNKQEFSPKLHENTVLIGNTKINVNIANSEKDRQKGLSGSTYLSKDSGMLFVFDTPGNYGFWMKDMNYAIDIIWIDKDYKIVSISKDIKPESYPEVFYPKSEILYVLEVNAGFSELNNISENELVVISK